MSNDRHLDNKIGTMGNLFRRMTMASLGLDAMDDVSQQSFDVIDRADTFAQRLLGGVNRMMPTGDFENLGVATSSDALWDELYSGILTNDGPKNATDVGEWQYWLDAVLLTLFDEDEDEEVSGSTGSSASAKRAADPARVKAAQAARAEALRKKQQIRERVAQLNASGVKPSMLRQLSSAKQREIAKQSGLADLSTAKYVELTSKFEKGEISGTKFVEMAKQAGINLSATEIAAFTEAKTADKFEKIHTESIVRDFAKSLMNVRDVTVVDSQHVQAAAGAKFDVLSMSSEQVLASHVVERARRLEASLEGRSDQTEAAKLVASWRENTERFTRSAHRDGGDIVALHEMQRLVGEMAKKGLVQESVVKQFKDSSRVFAARSLDNVLSKDFAGSLLLNRIEQGLNAVSANENDMLVSSRAVKGESNFGVAASKAMVAEKALSASFDQFHSTIQAFVANADENASTMRWTRAADRFDQMHGVSDEQDRVLLRDLIESATQLEASGVVPKGTVAGLVKSAAGKASADYALGGHVDMLQTLANDVSRNVTTMRAARTEKLGRQFNTVMSNVNGSLTDLVSSLKQAGLNQNVINPLVREITQLKLDENASLEESVSRVELLSHALDSFVEQALNTLPEQGYDMLETEKSFVAPESAQAETVAAAASSFKAGSAKSSAAQLNEVRAYVAQVQKLQQEAEAKFASMLNERSVQADAATREEIVRAIESHNVESLVKAQKSIAAKLDAKVNAQIAEAAQRMEQTRAHFETVARQVKQIERAADLASMLHLTSNQFSAYDVISSDVRNAVASASSKGIALGDVRIDKNYLPVLNESIAAYTKLRDEYARFETPMLNSIRIDEAAQRLERMTTLIQPSENASAGHMAADKAQFASTVSASVADAIARNAVGSMASRGEMSSVASRSEMSTVASRSEASTVASRSDAMMTRNNQLMAGSIVNDALDQQVGYDEIVPEAMNKVQAKAEDHRYASVDNVSSLASMFGAQKALKLHADGLVQGSTSEASAFRAALNEVMSEKASATPVSMLTVNELGERLKVTMAQGSAAERMALRQAIGQAYQPESLRNQDADVAMSMIDVQKLDQTQSISGVEHFVPVMLGGLTANAVQASDMAQGNETSNAFNHVAHTARFDAMDAESYDGERRLLSVSLAGTDVSMTPEAYVQAVAQPEISQSARALSLGSDALYDSFASVLAQQGAGRSLNTLRRAFFEKLSQAGRTTARGWIGLNSQSFSSLLGVEADNTSAMAFDSERGNLVKSDNASVDNFTVAADAAAGFETMTRADATTAFADQTADSIRSFVASESAKTAASSASVSANYGMNFVQAQIQNERKAAANASGELLGHIDSLLDYVEDVSTRNVGVFSTNDVVRVLIEQLPRESYLGERGLPQWRQKDARARKVEEARELREALRKIGATPVQGAQRFNDKKYVSPNLMTQPEQAAPLFSGGVESGSTPSGAANASGTTGNNTSGAGISEDDIQILVDACYERFMESLNKELKRGRR